MIKYQFKKKKKNDLILGNLYVQASLKNTIISLTKRDGKLLKQWSTKSFKKSKSKKNNPYNVQLIIYKINKFLLLKKIKQLNLYFKGSSLGRYNILKNLRKKIKIGFLFDTTPVAFNGCRQKKTKRR